MSIIGKYKNGNFTVVLMDNGTKIRSNNLDFFDPEFAESCDVKITDKCDGNCAFCYEGCTPNGKHGDIISPKFLDTIPPYTEIAINGNDLSHPDLMAFLEKMHDRKVVVNMTVNQLHFERHFEMLKVLTDQRLIHGLGISLREATQDFVDKVKTIPNAVIHVINGIVTMADLDTLAGNNLKILILGYKHLRRGVSYFEVNDELVMDLQEDLDHYLFPTIIKDGWFDIVSFDNLAIKQLHVQDHMPKEQWDTFYMGDDGNFSFYIDMVEGVFAKNSLSMERYPITDDIKEMFRIIKEKSRE
jgi:hypothetical protein